MCGFRRGTCDAIFVAALDHDRIIDPRGRGADHGRGALLGLRFALLNGFKVLGTPITELTG